MSWKYFYFTFDPGPHSFSLGNAHCPTLIGCGVEAGKTYSLQQTCATGVNLGASTAGRGKGRSHQVQVDRFRREGLCDKDCARPLPHRS